MPAGRPTLLTEELILQVEELLPRCWHLETVADALGIASSTFRDWLRKGERLTRRLKRDADRKHTEAERLLLEFSAAIKRGLAQRKQDCLKIIYEAAGKYWQAAAWLLERRFPDEWGDHAAAVRKLQKDVDEMRGEGRAGRHKRNRKKGPA